MEVPSDSDEEDDYVYNPLKLPLGPDGKPIPYWLYKLHGLNQARFSSLLHRGGGGGLSTGLAVLGDKMAAAFSEQH